MFIRYERFTQHGKQIKFRLNYKTQSGKVKKCKIRMTKYKDFISDGAM